MADGGEKYLQTILIHMAFKERNLISESVWEQLDNWFSLPTCLGIADDPK